MKVPMLAPERFWNIEGLKCHLPVIASRVIGSGRYIMGPEVQALERRCEQFLSVKHAIAVSSGTDALLLALMAYGIGPGDEVICPSFTFFATAGSVARLGATPVFVDVLPDCFTIDPEAVEAAITPRTKAIIPVHLFGQCADMEAILQVARVDGRKIPVIEDACQAIGATLKSEVVGSIGDVGCFSFFPSKNLGGFGDGGLVTTNDPELNAKMRSLRVHGSDVQYVHDLIGGNFRMDTLQAALLLEKFEYFDTQLAKRIAHAHRYIERLDGRGSFLVPREVRGLHSWNQFTLRSSNRGKLREYLERCEIASAIYYPVPLHQQPCFAYLPQVSLPRTEQACREVLSIPVTSELHESEVDYVIDRLNTFAWLVS